MSTALLAAILSMAAPSRIASQRIEPVPFTAVKLTDRFWAPRAEAARKVTIPTCFRQCEQTGRIANFDRAAGKDPTPFQGNCYDDSDVYKVIEGAAYSLAQHPDPELDAYLDALIARIAAAQESDGYLYTIATANKRPKDARWKDERWSHETYCAGHLFEAAVAHYQATGKKSLLDVAQRFANLLVEEFLKNGRPEVPGHEEVEIGLVRLYRITHEQAYLDLARHFLQRRGDPKGRELYGDYCQDHMPLVDQREAVGHAVRAAYLYSGMADVAAVSGDATFDAALDAIWKDCVGTKTYVTGGIGAIPNTEGFGKPYELPNESAYNETCAAIASCLWNERMFLRSGSSAPVDVLERTLYNGMLAGVSLEGDKFFYPNPLACDGIRPFNHGTLGRAPWFGCACCPVNVARFLPSVAGYVYATSTGDHGDAIYVNLYVQSEAVIELRDAEVAITQTTEFPWKGVVAFTIDPNREGGPDERRAFTLALRIPAWARSEVLPGGPYSLKSKPAAAAAWTVSVNGENVPSTPLRDGYVRIDRTWKAGDRVRLELPMRIDEIVARDEIESTRGRIALGRGPFVYCVEGIDVDGASHTLRDIWLPDDATVSPIEKPALLGGIVALGVQAKRADGSDVELTAVPYALWANREVGEMAVWLPRTAELAEHVPPPTLASRATPSASHTWVSDTPRALNDRRLPKSSSDGTIPRHTWWDRKGSIEWVQYDWPESVAISKASVWFFDDTGNSGGCALPKAWRLLTKQGDSWVPIAARYDVRRDAPSEVSFPTVNTTALRLEVALEAGRSGGVLEWTVE
ncbi:MAG: glycoside hydrolase family 127 protein [Phycisphaerales bacterium]